MSDEKGKDAHFATEEERDAVAWKLSVGMGLKMTAMTMVVPTRAPLVLQIKKGDASATARAMGKMSATAAVLELIINPILGKLSDQYGRRPFLTLGPAVNAFLHTLVAIFPDKLAMQFIDRGISGAMLFGYLAPTQAALADLYAADPQKLGVQQAIANMYFGIGCMVGPLIGSKIGGAKSFLASALAFVGTLFFARTSINETLAPEKRKLFKFSDINPAAFLKLFKNRTLGWLAVTTGLHSLGDYANVYDINNLFMLKVLGYNQSQIGNFATTVGATQILGGRVSAKIIKATSLKTSSVFSIFIWCLGMAMMGRSRNERQAFTALFIWTFGHNRNTPTASYLQKYGGAEGMGRAEIVAAAGNLAAYIKVLIPLLYGNLFSWGTSGGRDVPGLPYFVICGLTALSQMTFQLASPSD